MSLKQPNNPIFFIDRSLGKRSVAGALKDAGYQVIVHDDLFPPNTEDEVWLSQAGKNGWVVLSRDSRIRYRGNEKAALEQAGVLAIILTANNLTGEQMAQIFLKAAKKMTSISVSEPRPAIYTLGRDGKPKLIK